MGAQPRTKARGAGSVPHAKNERLGTRPVAALDTEGDREAGRAGVAVESPVCAVCGESASDVVCSADEVRRQLDWVKQFHLRRLKVGRSGKPPRAALEDRADFTQGFVTNVVACRECGLVYRDPRPTSEAVEATYAHDSYGEARLKALADSQHELYVPKVAALRRWLPAGHEVRIVELGSFVGGFLVAALTEQWDVRGIDPGEEVAAFCQKRGLPVFCGTLEEADLPESSVDCVAVWNTFDQLAVPTSTLDAIRRVLRPRGILAIRVPNGRFFRSSMRRLRHARVGGPIRTALAWNNLLGFPYLYGYSVPTLDRLLARYDMRRIAAHPDTLVRLSDCATRRWAELEERIVKLGCRAAWTLARGAGRRDYVAAPWLDVYYRLAE